MFIYGLSLYSNYKSSYAVRYFFVITNTPPQAAVFVESLRRQALKSLTKLFIHLFICSACGAKNAASGGVLNPSYTINWGQSFTMSREYHQDLLLEIYERLRRHNGHRRWWPGDSSLEIIIGAILTQNTNWSNVSKAIDHLKKADVLTVERLSDIEEKHLAQLIRPSGYFNQKASRLKGFIAWLKERYEGDISRMFQTRLPQLREELLALKGIGQETADSILLYAGGKKTFVIDAYTKRIFSRHGLIAETAKYDEMKGWFEKHLPKRLDLYNDYHAQIVWVGATKCKRAPKCEECPLNFLFDKPGLKSRKELRRLIGQ